MVICVLAQCAAAFAVASGEVPLYLNPREPVEKRIDDLLRRMTLQEKIGQINMPCVYADQLGKDTASKLIDCKRFAEGTLTGEMGPGGGFFTLANEILREVGPRSRPNTSTNFRMWPRSRPG